MLNKNAQNEFCDIELVGNMTYGDDDICQIVEDSKILDVVGKIANGSLSRSLFGV